MTVPRELPPYRESLAGRLVAAREAVMAPVRPILREAGITEQQWRVLRVLIDRGASDLSAVARSALLRAPSLTRILRELERRELVLRHPDAGDARRSIVAISASGRALVDQTMVVTLQMLDRYADAFGVGRLRMLLSELALLTGTIADPDDLVDEE